MSDIPMLARSSVVRNMLSGAQTQDRRPAWKEGKPAIKGDGRPTIWQQVRPGDRIWIKEAWFAAHGADSTPPREMTPEWSIDYAATPRGYAEIGIKGKLRPMAHNARFLNGRSCGSLLTTHRTLSDGEDHE